MGLRGEPRAQEGGVGLWLEGWQKWLIRAVMLPQLGPRANKPLLTSVEGWPGLRRVPQLP